MNEPDICETCGAVVIPIDGDVCPNCGEWIDIWNPYNPESGERIR